MRLSSQVQTIILEYEGELITNYDATHDDKNQIKSVRKNMKHFIDSKNHDCMRSQQQ